MLLRNPVIRCRYFRVNGFLTKFLSIGAGVYCFSRYATDMGVRHDVAKVPVEDLAVNMGWFSPPGSTLPPPPPGPSNAATPPAADNTPRT